jgi:Cytochrome c oxidase subunit IV
MAAEPGDVRDLRFEIGLFAALTAFLVLAGVGYYLFSDEWAGTVLLILGGGLAAITAGYFFLQARLAAGDDEGDVDEPEAETDHASIWPLEMGAGMTVAFLGLVLGRFVLLFGLVLVVHSLVGWIAQSRAS